LAGQSKVRSSQSAKWCLAAGVFSAQAGRVKEAQPEGYDLFQKGYRQKAVGAAFAPEPLAGGVLPTPCLLFVVENAANSQTPEKFVEFGPALRQE
jgi:hypothetical protein